MNSKRKRNIDQTAFYLVQQCQQAYLDDSHFEGALYCHFYDSYHVEAYLLEYNNHYVLIFRGTDSIEDWLYNINIRGQQTNIGVVHSGFYQSFLLFWNKYKQHLITLTKPLYLTGHSFGGCLSILCGLHLQLENKTDISIYTFGSPKLFITLPELKQLEIHRYELEGDFITYLPLTHYRPVGTTHRIKPVQKQSIYSRIKEWYLYWSFCFRINITDFTHNHKMASYVKALST